jgi:hypothetical protein
VTGFAMQIDWANGGEYQAFGRDIADIRMVAP